MNLYRIYKIIFIVSFFILETAYAATFPIVPTDIPTSALPGRNAGFLRGPLHPQLKSVPLPKQEAEAEVTPGAEKIKFFLSHVNIDGNTVFSTAELEEIFRPLLNKTISLADLQIAVHNVTKKYREAGYILSRAILPPQTIKNGIVRVQIIEGFISNFTIEGDAGKARCLLQSYGNYIMQSRPLNIKILERYTLLANDLPGFNVKSVLTPSKTIPASADLTLIVERQRGDASLTYDNFNTRYLGPNEMTVSSSLYSILAGGDNNTLRATGAIPKLQKMQFVEFIHTQPLGCKGARWLLGGNYTQTRPEFTLEPLQIVGRTAWLFGDVSYPLIRSRNKNSFIHGAFNYENVTSTILNSPFYQDRIRSLVAGAGYQNFDSWNGLNNIGLDVTHGFEVLGAHDHVNQSRPDGQSVYTRINLNLSRLQQIKSRFSVLGALQSQYAYEPLLASEQFGVGGPVIGRGYDPSEIIGDRGLAGKIEFRVDTAPELKLLNTVQYYVFFDAGVVWNIDDVNLPGRQTETSTGFGARFNFMPQLSGNLYLAKPLSRKESTLVLLGENPNQFRGYFQIVANL